MRRKAMTRLFDKYVTIPMLHATKIRRHDPVCNVISAGLGLTVGIIISIPVIARTQEERPVTPLTEPISYDMEIQVPEQQVIVTKTEVEIDTNVIFQESAAIEESAKPDAIQAPIKTEISEAELQIFAKCVEAEASGEGFEGKCLVADVILNRMDSSLFPGSTVTDVIMQHNKETGVWQFSVAGNGMLEAAQPTQETYDAILHELECRSYPGLLYFTSEGYSPYGTPWKKVGNHYFSTAG